MPKNIVICCDGTANEFAKHNTNVVKLYSVLRHDPKTQVTYYHPGLGTMEPEGALTTLARKVTKILGMAVGYGLANDVRDAYVFLMKHYVPEDKVFLFGLSRGAYIRKTARRMNRHRRRTIPAKSLVHFSAFERGAEYQKRLPPDAVRVDRKSP